MNNKQENRILAEVLVIVNMGHLRATYGYFSNNAIVQKCSFAKAHSSINILFWQKENC